MALKLTPALKTFLVAQGWAAADADDDRLKRVAAKRLVKGDLTYQKLAELSGDAPPPTPPASGNIVYVTADQLAKALADFKAQATPPSTPPPAAPPAAPPILTIEQVNEAVAKHLASLGANNPAGHGGMPTLLSRSADVLSRPEARVKGAIEQFSDVKTAAICPLTKRDGGASNHPHAGQPATYMGNALDHPSERGKAIAAVWWKFAISKSNRQDEIPRRLQMTDQDWDILHWTLKNCKWSGYLRSDVTDDRGEPDTADTIYVGRRKLTEFEQKALLDDSTSGGIEIAPIEFDDALVTYPVLFGELFPYVNVMNMQRGRRIKGGSLVNPTFTSGIAEGTAITPFNTNSFVSAFDTSIFTAVGAMEIGLDFEEDSPTNVGGIIVQKYGEKALEWLDRVVAIGDGVTEPQGIFTSSAVTVTNSDYGTFGPATISDLEGLLFGVPKAFRQAKGMKNVYIGNDVSYRRIRAIPVGPGDERRLFGLTHQDYQVLNTPFKINVFIPNNKLAYVNLGFYRMYRRLGLNVRIETAGNYLATRNLRLIVVRMRYGGQLELGGAGTIMTDAQS